jgi:hypothetical protein
MHMTFSGSRVPLAIFWLCLTASDCSQPGESPAGKPAPSSSKSQVRIGAVLPIFSHPFFLAQNRGLEGA